MSKQKNFDKSELFTLRTLKLILKTKILDPFVGGVQNSSVKPLTALNLEKEKCCFYSKANGEHTDIFLYRLVHPSEKK